MDSPSPFLLAAPSTQIYYDAMKILFPSRPSDSCVDSAFQVEKEAAEAAGFQTALVDISLNFGGGSAGIPDGTDPKDFYTALKHVT